MENLSRTCHHLLCAPFYELLHKDIEWKWENEQKQAFKKIKKAMMIKFILSRLVTTHKNVCVTKTYIRHDKNCKQFVNK